MLRRFVQTYTLNALLIERSTQPRNSFAKVSQYSFSDILMWEWICFFIGLLTAHLPRLLTQAAGARRGARAVKVGVSTQWGVVFTSSLEQKSCKFPLVERHSWTIVHIVIKAPNLAHSSLNIRWMDLDIGPLQIFILITLAAIFKNSCHWLLEWNPLSTLQLLFHVFNTTNII